MVLWWRRVPGAGCDQQGFPSYELSMRAAKTVRFEWTGNLADVWSATPVPGSDDLLLCTDKCGVSACFSFTKNAMVQTYPPLVRKPGGFAPSHHVYPPAFSHDNARIALPCFDGSLSVWDIESGECLTTLWPRKMHKKDRFCFSASFDSNGQFLICACGEGTVVIYDAVTFQERAELKGHGPVWVTSVDCSADGRKVLTCSNDKTARVWYLDDQTPCGVFSHTHRLFTAVFHPRGKRFMSGDKAGWINEWNITNTEKPLRRYQLATFITAAPKQIHTDFAPAGARAELTASASHTSEAPHAGNELPLVWVRSVQYSKDGNYLLAAYEGQSSAEKGYAAVWRLDSGVTAPPVAMARHTTCATTHAAWMVGDSAIVATSKDGLARVHELVPRAHEIFGGDWVSHEVLPLDVADLVLDYVCSLAIDII